MGNRYTHELGRRLFCTIIILVIYMIGRNISLLGVDLSVWQYNDVDQYNLLISMISGDRYRHSIFALGIMPYITSSLLMMIYMAIRGSDYKSRISPQKLNRITFMLMLPLAFISAVSYSNDLYFIDDFIDLDILQILSIIQMMIGAIIIYLLADYNKNNGIGGQTTIILVNVLDNFILTVDRIDWFNTKSLLILCIILSVIILVMENIIIRIPVQRVSIHNVYADKNYIAFKLNPIGVMPVMFAISFFMIPQFILKILLKFFTDNDCMQRMLDSLTLSDMTGIIVYLAIIFILDVVFSFIMITPGEIATQLQKNGDSIVGIYAGYRTKKYLRRKVLLLSCISGVVLSVMMGISLVLSIKGVFSAEWALFPSTVMILIGLICPVCHEIRAYLKFDSYSIFL